MARKKHQARGRSTGRTVSEALRGFVEARDLADHQLGKLAGIAPGQIGRFMRRERELSGPSIDRLATALGLELVERSRGRGRPAATRGVPAPDARTGGSDAHELDRPGDVGRLQAEDCGPDTSPGSPSVIA